MHLRNGDKQLENDDSSDIDDNDLHGASTATVTNSNVIDEANSNATSSLYSSSSMHSGSLSGQGTPVKTSNTSSNIS